MVVDLIICILAIAFSIFLPAYVQAMKRVYQWRRDCGYQYTNYVPEDCVFGAMTKSDIIAAVAVLFWVPIVMMILDLFLTLFFAVVGQDRFLRVLYPVTGVLVYLSFYKVYQIVWDIAERNRKEES